MKSILLVTSMLLSGSIFAEQNIRELCENAYYATGYVELHQYDVTVDWSRLSDHGHVELESVVFGDNFKLLRERDLSNGKTVYSIKEVSGADASVYESGLEVLQRLTFQGVACRWARPAR